MKIYLVINEKSICSYERSIHHSSIVSTHSSLEKANEAARKYIFNSYEKCVAFTNGYCEFNERDRVLEGIRKCYTFPDPDTSFETQSFKYYKDELGETFSIYIKEDELD